MKSSIAAEILLLTSVSFTSYFLTKKNFAFCHRKQVEEIFANDNECHLYSFIEWMNVLDGSFSCSKAIQWEKFCVLHKRCYGKHVSIYEFTFIKLSFWSSEASMNEPLSTKELKQEQNSSLIYWLFESHTVDIQRERRRKSLLHENSNICYHFICFMFCDYKVICSLLLLAKCK